MNFERYQSREVDYDKLIFYTHFFIATCGIKAVHEKTYYVAPEKCVFETIGASLQKVVPVSKTYLSL
jgi:hypothetical protein